jgi:hypothetical protein
LLIVNAHGTCDYNLPNELGSANFVANALHFRGYGSGEYVSLGLSESE